MQVKNKELFRTQFTYLIAFTMASISFSGIKYLISVSDNLKEKK